MIFLAFLVAASTGAAVGYVVGYAVGHAGANRLWLLRWERIEQEQLRRELFIQEILSDTKTKLREKGQISR